MATIALYADKVSQMTGLIAGVKQSVIDYKAELTALRTKAMGINSSVCNTDDVVASIKASMEIQDRKIKTLETIRTNVGEFVTDAVRIDNDVADLINRRKDEFYKKFSHLKPDSEMNGWDKFVNGCKKVVEWCRDNWKSIGKIVLAVVIIAVLGVASVLTGGILAVILAGAFWGALSGALISGVLGVITSTVDGGSFLDGFADGVLSGAVMGAITGAIFSGVGLGINAIKNAKYLSSISKFGNFKKGNAFAEKVGRVFGRSAAKEITLNLNNGARCRIDFAIKNRITGKVQLYEVKSSETAKFTSGQLNSFAKNGNRLIDNARFTAKGRKLFGDMLINKGTPVQIVRPSDLLTLRAKANISLPSGVSGALFSKVVKSFVTNNNWHSMEVMYG